MPPIEFSVDERDIRFTLFEQLQIDNSIMQLDAFKEYDRDTIDLVLDGLIQFATKTLAPTNQDGDSKEAVYDQGSVRIPESFRAAYQEMCESGWSALAQDPEFGGAGFPETIATVFREMITGANTSFSLFMILNQGAGHLIEAFGNEEQKKTYVEKMYTGQWGGTMCLTEPQAGSDLAACTTMATPEGDHYLLKGTKIFITNGDQDLTDNIIHTVLARVPGAPAGTKGISLFLVPKYFVHPDGSLGERNDVRCERIEHKMGIKASPTCVMSFGDNDQCKGWLIGELNAGMFQMFQMMNEARLGVGAQGLANGAAAYMSALGYATERKQGSHVKRFKDPKAEKAEIIQHPDVRRMMMTMKSYTEGVRCLIYATASYIDLSKHHTDPEQRAFYHSLVELLTPICKSYGSDMGFRVTDMAVQTFGGYGYTQEYPVEQYLRDAKIAAIYEGTNGIQAIDLVMRKLTQKDGYRFKQFLQFVDQKLAQWEGHALQDVVTTLKTYRDGLIATTEQIVGFIQKGNALQSLLNACPYLEMFGNFISAVYLAEAAVIAYDKLHALYAEKGIDVQDTSARRAFLYSHSDAAFYHTKVQTSLFFNRHILIKNLAFAEEIKNIDDSAIEAIFLGESELQDSFF